MWTPFLDSLQRHPLVTGIIGTTASVGASAVTFLQQLDLFVRVAGGVVGLGIGVVTLVIQIRNLRRK